MRLASVLLSLALVAAPSAADQPPPFRATNFSRPAPGSLVVLLPPVAEATELEPGVPLLLKALHAELSSAGLRAVLLDKTNYEAIWAQEVDAVGGVFDSRSGRHKPLEYAAAMSALSVRLARETSAALVIDSRLVARKAEVSGTKANWDGRLESIPVRGAFVGSTSHRGTTTAISVRLTAMSQTGEFAFVSFGGVTLPYTINFVTEKYEVRTNLFDSIEDVAKGAKIALTPLTQQ